MRQTQAMKPHVTRTFLLTSATLLAACSAPSPAPDAANSASGLCFTDGTILTATVPATADMLISTDDRITHIGAMTDCPTGHRNIDLAGATLMPGLTDAHAHLIGIGLREMTLNLEGTESIADLQSRVRKAASNLEPDATLYGRGWIETFWPEDRFPTAADIDAVVSDRPVLLERSDGHALVANTAALRLADITGNTPAPDGGAINLDANGTPTGMLIDNAIGLVSDLMPGLEPDTKREAYRRGAELYAARGWTNIHNMSQDPADVAVLEEMDAAGDLPIRVYNSLDTRDLSRVRDASPDDKVVTRAIKLYGDGALGSRGAALLKPYSDDPGNDGLMILSDDVVAVLEAAAAQGVQVNTHAIGDRANRSVLHWYEQTMPSGARWRVEHTQIVDPADIPRYAALGVIPSMQPSHAIGDLHFAPDRLGPDRLVGGYAWRSLIDSGAIIAGGSDAPVEVGDPRIEFHAATQRTDLKGFSNQDWSPEERVSESEALKMFTSWPAYAAFQEDELGTLETGKLADFSIFTGSLTEGNAMSAEPVMTVVDGEVVWEQKFFFPLMGNRAAGAGG